MANYHPHDELLMSFAAGQLPNALGVMIACHLEHCSACRKKVSQYEALGGELMSTIEPASSVSETCLEGLLSRLDEPAPKAPEVIGRLSVPRPLRRFVPTDINQLPWSGMSKNIKEFNIPISDKGFTAKLYKISAGKVLPEHTHEGNEFTMVLEGSFSDHTCDYHAGDFILADTQTVHQPRAAESGDCICFAVMDAPLKMTGFFGRMLNPFLR